jgi:prophage regulatory protein
MQSTETQFVDPQALIRMNELVGRRDPKTRRRVNPIVPVAPPTISRWVKAGAFPRPVALGPNLVAWRGSDLNAWIAAKRPKA